MHERVSDARRRKCRPMCHGRRRPARAKAGGRPPTTCSPGALQMRRYPGQVRRGTTVDTSVAGYEAPSSAVTHREFSCPRAAGRNLPDRATPPRDPGRTAPPPRVPRRPSAAATTWSCHSAEQRLQLRHHLLGEQLGVVLRQLLAHVAELQQQHQVADIQLGRHLGKLRHDFIRRADDDVAQIDDVLHLGRPHPRPGAARRGAADLAFDAGALRRLGDVARRRRPHRIGVQAAAIEILGGFAIQLQRLLTRFRDADELQEAGAIWIAVLAQARHFAPEAVHRRLAVLVAEIRQIRVDVVHARAPLPRLDRAAAGNPHRRMRLLHRARPDVHIALLVIAAVEGERLRLLPGRMTRSCASR